MSGKYILDGHTPVLCDDLIKWGRWFETADRRVALTEYPDAVARVSTVFLGLDHNFGTGRPLLFETMVFGAALPKELDEYQERYETWEGAEAGHAAAVALVDQALEAMARLAGP